MVTMNPSDGADTPDVRELLVALYDSLYERLEDSVALFDSKQPARAREHLRKARAIVGDLWVGLDHAAAPELCSQVAAVLDFALSRLSEANRDGNSRPVHDAARALTPLREALSRCHSPPRGA